RASALVEVGVQTVDRGVRIVVERRRRPARGWDGTLDLRLLIHGAGPARHDRDHRDDDSAVPHGAHHNVCDPDPCEAWIGTYRQVIQLLVAAPMPSTRRKATRADPRWSLPRASKRTMWSTGGRRVTIALGAPSRAFCRLLAAVRRRMYVPRVMRLARRLL